MEIVFCKDCTHRPYVEEGKVKEPKDINGYTDYTCPLCCDDSYYNRMPADDFFCAHGEKRKFGIMIKNYPVPACCDNCDCFDTSGDYPFCLLTHHSTGYKFDYLNKRMDDCPLVVIEEREMGGKKVFIEVAGKEND